MQLVLIYDENTTETAAQPIFCVGANCEISRLWCVVELVCYVLRDLYDRGWLPSAAASAAVDGNNGMW